MVANLFAGILSKSLLIESFITFKKGDLYDKKSFAFHFISFIDGGSSTEIKTLFQLLNNLFPLVMSVLEKKLTHRGKFDYHFSGDCFRFASTQLD